MDNPIIFAAILPDCPKDKLPSARAEKEKLVVASVDLVVADCLLDHWDCFYKNKYQFCPRNGAVMMPLKKKTDDNRKFQLPVPGVDFH